MRVVRHIACLALLAACCAASYSIGRGRAGNGPILPVSVRTDTLIFRDTIREKYPVYIDRRVERTELVRVTDTLRVRDTLYMGLDIEVRTYQGDDYRAVVAGIRPELREISVYPKTVHVGTTATVQQPQRRVRVGFGATAGPGVFWDGSPGIRPGVGVTAGMTVVF